MMDLDYLPQDEKDRFVEMAQETILNRVLLRLADLMGEEDLAKFRTLVEEDKADEVVDFLAAREIDIEQIAAQEALAYKTEMAAMADSLDQANKGK